VCAVILDCTGALVTFLAVRKQEHLDDGHSPTNFFFRYYYRISSERVQML